MKIFLAGYCHKMEGTTFVEQLKSLNVLGSFYDLKNSQFLLGISIKKQQKENNENQP